MIETDQPHTAKYGPNGTVEGQGDFSQAPAPWQPIETAPEAGLTERDPETVLLWVADGGHGGKGTHAFGRCYKSHDGSIRATASGFHGNWRITHWMPLPAPPETTP